MTYTTQQGLVPRATLSPDELLAAKELALLCNAHENLVLKLGLDAPAPVNGGETNNFLFYEGGKLAGYCAIDYGELCGMVHPQQRRKGIGSALLDAAVDECKQRATDDLLIICERASRSGQDFVARSGVSFSFAEHHMELRTTPDWGTSFPVDPNLQVYRASSDDLDLLTRLTTESFGGFEESTKQRIAHDMEIPTERFYIANLGQDPISMLKIVDARDKAGIYAFSVLPEYRGRGHGKQVLTSIIKDLMSEGYTHFSLEVETNNYNAIGLYQACGFEVTTTYEYFKLRPS